MIELQIHIPGCDKKCGEIIKTAAEKTLLIAGERKKFDLTISICSEEYIQNLNKTFRNIDRPTDVLSFSEEYLIPGSEIIYLGDIAISFPAAKAQALEGGHSVDDELSLLTIHGVLHLLGYDHHDEIGKSEMWKRQFEVLESLGIHMTRFSGDE